MQRELLFLFLAVSMHAEIGIYQFIFIMASKQLCKILYGPPFRILQYSVIHFWDIRCMRAQHKSNTMASVRLNSICFRSQSARCGASNNFGFRYK